MDDLAFLTEDFEANVDLTPLVDVVFMLLLFFILAATFSHPVMQVALPAAETAARVPEDPNRLVFVINDAGMPHLGQTPIALEDIPALLAGNDAEKVELRVDSAAPFNAFVGVMDQLRAAGRNDVLITTQPH